MKHININHLKDSIFSNLDKIYFNNDILYYLKHHKDENIISDFFNFFEKEVLKLKKEYNADMAFFYKTLFMPENEIKRKNISQHTLDDEQLHIFFLNYNYGKIQVSKIKFKFLTNIDNQFLMSYKLDFIKNYYNFRYSNYILELFEEYLGKIYGLNFFKSQIYNFSEEYFIDDFLKTLNKKNNNNNFNF